MDSAMKTPANFPPVGQPMLMPEALERANDFLDEGNVEAAIRELEAGLEDARHTPGAMDSQARTALATMLSDIYQEAGEFQKARRMLGEELAFLEGQFEQVKQSGNPFEKRKFFTDLTVLRDNHTRVSLIGEPAPEILVKHWINSDPLSLESLRGRLLLLEFWATWCRSCVEVFPKVKRFHQQHAERGLSVLALTRHYYTSPGPVESAEKELELIHAYVREHSLEFPVGVSEDATTQMAYGAVGLPTVALIDRRGVVRAFGRFDAGEEGDPLFEETLARCLEET
ncbi:MAG: TlpA family protein disulfide reductase [Pyrinomonadaceae bacterium]|nr:TlpA family protein disulfide reductase [Pyrinomonadaceae bacterium]